jgi:Fic family protein
MAGKKQEAGKNRPTPPPTWVSKPSSGPRALALLDELIVNPYVTVARAEQALKVSNPTARQAVALLQKHRVLKEVSGRQWGSKEEIIVRCAIVN